MDISDFLHKSEEEVDPTEGMLLLSAPMTGDVFFNRSVILILDREANGGHLGLILNHDLNLPMNQLLEDWPGTENLNLFNGGPVEPDRLFLLHRLGHILEGADEILPGIFAGGNYNQLRNYIASGNTTEGLIRFFIGYSGWGPGQLTKEILDHNWAILRKPNADELLKGEGPDYWTAQVKHLGPEYRSWLNIPDHPFLN